METIFYGIVGAGGWILLMFISGYLWPESD